MSDIVIAAIIGSAATLITALVQVFLRLKEPATAHAKPKRRLSLPFILALMLCSAIGGFGYSEYRNQQNREEITLLKELQMRMSQLTASVEHIGRNNLASAGVVTLDVVAAPSPTKDARKEALGLVHVPACKRTNSPSTVCAETDAIHASVCAAIPESGKASEVLLFARGEETNSQPWTTNRVEVGQDVGGGRFINAPVERLDGQGNKWVCQEFIYWNADKGRLIRIAVR